MAIKSIRVENFKSSKDVEVHLGNFNVLIGANASGKSNFIHIIEFLRDIQRHGLENGISLQGGPEYLTNLNIGPRENLFVEVGVYEYPDRAPDIGISRKKFLCLLPTESRYSFAVVFPAQQAGLEVVDERLSVKGEFCTVKRSQSDGPLQREGLGEIVVVREADKPSVKFTPPEAVSMEEYKVEPWLMRRNVSSRSLLLQGGLFSAGGPLMMLPFTTSTPSSRRKGRP